MFDFNTEEIKFLRDLSDTNDGLRLRKILSNARLSIGDISKIETSADYGAQVEGRKIALMFLDSILNKMSKRDTSFAPETRNRRRDNSDDWT